MDAAINAPIMVGQYDAGTESTFVFALVSGRQFHPMATHPHLVSILSMVHILVGYRD